MNAEDLLPITMHIPKKSWNGKPTPSRRELLWIKEGKKCHWCGCPTHLDADGWEKTTIDHVIPRYKGGPHDESNMVAACSRCNNRRNHEDVLGLKDGALLGKFKVNSVLTPKPKTTCRISLTRDDKRAIMGKKTELEVVREARDQALKSLMALREEVKVKDEMIASLHESLRKAREEAETITVWELFKDRMTDRLLTWLRD